MFFSSLKKKIKKKITIQSPSILNNLEKSNIYNKYHNHKNTSFFSFGKKNPDKTFYIIKKTPGAGLFSNVLFILNHLKIAKNKNYIPFVDMQNFHTIYNEKNKIYKTKNAWEYYFENFSDYAIDEIYQSQNVYITSNLFEETFFKDLNTEEITKFFREHIRIKKNYSRFIKNFSDKNFENKKILGIHFRGTSYKNSPGHPFPATKKQIINKINELQLYNKFDKIFLVTEEENYKKFLISKFGEKILFIKSSYRSNKNDAFKVYPRRSHRFKMGREALIETLLLSKCDYLIHITSNISSAAIAWQLNKDQKRYRIDNGLNVNNIFIAEVLWYIKKILPESLGGFKC